MLDAAYLSPDVNDECQVKSSCSRKFIAGRTVSRKKEKEQRAGDSSETSVFGNRICRSAALDDGEARKPARSLPPRAFGARHAQSSTSTGPTRTRMRGSCVIRRGKGCARPVELCGRGRMVRVHTRLGRFTSTDRNMKLNREHCVSMGTRPASRTGGDYLNPL